jgi:hypothetical protein
MKPTAYSKDWLRSRTDEELNAALVCIDDSVLRLSDGSCMLDIYYERYSDIEGELARRSYVRDECSVLGEAVEYVSRTRSERRI